MAQANGYAEANQFWGSPRSTAEGYSSANATGIAAGDGQNSVVSSGVVTVQAIAEAVPYATADTDIDYSYSKAYSSTAASAVGIRAGDGHNDIHNQGDIVVGARGARWARAYSDEDSRIGEGEGRHLSNSLEAIGIQLGDGSNRVINDGRILINNEEGYYLASTTATANANAIPPRIGSLIPIQANKDKIPNTTNTFFKMFFIFIFSLPPYISCVCSTSF